MYFQNLLTMKKKIIYANKIKILRNLAVINNHN